MYNLKAKYINLNWLNFKLNIDSKLILYLYSVILIHLLDHFSFE